MSTIKNTASSIIFTVFVLALPTSANADICADEAGRADMAIREQYQQSIDYYLRLAAAAQAKGFDPRHFPQADFSGGVQVLDLIQIASDLTAKRDQGIGAIYASFRACRDNFAPYQNIVNTAVFFLTGGFSQVVPQNALYIDAGRLLAGTPFGGQGAIVPQFREQIMSWLGISGPVANLIRNPLQIGPNGPIQIPWTPVFGPIGGIPGGLPNLPNIPPINIPLPAIQSPPPIELGKVGGHRVCLPWC